MIRVEIDIESTGGQAPTPLTTGWADTRMVAGTNEWRGANDVYTELMPHRYCLADGLRVALSHDNYYHVSGPPGYRPVVYADGRGEFVALAVQAAPSLGATGGDSNCGLVRSTCDTVAAWEQALPAYADTDDQNELVLEDNAPVAATGDLDDLVLETNTPSGIARALSNGEQDFEQFRHNDALIDISSMLDVTPPSRALWDGACPGSMV